MKNCKLWLIMWHRFYWVEFILHSRESCPGSAGEGRGKVEYDSLIIAAPFCLACFVSCRHNSHCECASTDSFRHTLVFAVFAQHSLHCLYVRRSCYRHMSCILRGVYTLGLVHFFNISFLWSYNDLECLSVVYVDLKTMYIYCVYVTMYSVFSFRVLLLCLIHTFAFIIHNCVWSMLIYDRCFKATLQYINIYSFIMSACCK